MCRLLGLVANKPVDLEFSLVKFKEFASWNPDGWGIGWYENKKIKKLKFSNRAYLPYQMKVSCQNFQKWQAPIRSAREHQEGWQDKSWQTALPVQDLWPDLH